MMVRYGMERYGGLAEFQNGNIGKYTICKGRVFNNSTRSFHAEFAHWQSSPGHASTLRCSITTRNHGYKSINQSINHSFSFFNTLLSLPKWRSTSGRVLLPSLKLMLSMTTLACSKKLIWIMFWRDERRMIISTPFHLLERIAAWESVLVADDKAEGEAGAGVPVLTRLFCARVFIVSSG